jgi:acyl-CoA synthetase (AMP-forming)/AMP-acid ligase II
VLDEDGCEVATGEVGKLYASSPYVFSGYYEDPAATEAVTRDGHVTAGDLARRDDEGYLYIVGRATDVILSGGVNVYPREVEEYLAEHAGVREAVVFGVPDQYWGEAVHAVVVPAPDAPKPTPDELLAHCRAGLAAAKVPKSISMRRSLPRTPTGKVVKRELVEELTRGTNSERDARTSERAARGLADQGERRAG